MRSKSILISGTVLMLTTLTPVAVSAQDLRAGPEAAERQTAQPTATGSCVTNRSAFRTETGRVSTRSTALTNVPSGSVSFNQSSADCVLVRFSAETYAFDNSGINVRAVLDGTTTALPGNVIWTRDQDEDRDGRDIQVRAFEFVFANVPPGPHTVQMQWSSSNGATVFLWFRTIVVQHR